MEKILISLPNQLAARMRATIPPRQRSKVFTHLIEEEVEKRERALYECALAVENDTGLRSEMSDWEITLADGLSEEDAIHSKKQKINKPQAK